MTQALCQPNENGTCDQCGNPATPAIRQQCRAWTPADGVPVAAAPEPALRDTATRDGQPFEVLMLRKPCASLGAKKLYDDGSPLMTKQCGCCNTPENTQPIIFTPVYACSKFRLCAPFAKKIEDDASPVHPCIGCASYERPLA